MSCVTPEKSDMKFVCENIKEVGMKIGSQGFSISTQSTGRGPDARRMNRRFDNGWVQSFVELILWLDLMVGIVGDVRKGRGYG